jgi:hypothetical protein
MRCTWYPIESDRVKGEEDIWTPRRSQQGL